MTTTKNDQEFITLVRKRLVLEELVISREEFNQLNEQVANEEFYWSELEWEDSGFEDYCEENTTYCAYEGDVTSFTDDAVAFKYPDAKWVETFTLIECTKT
jgi:hypothetical protein